jgi:replicative DNA helicase
MSLQKLSDVVRNRNEELAVLYERTGAGEDVELQYISTGLPSLDELGLLERGILTVIGGDPGSGKSAWAVKLLESAARQGYKPQGYFFEDPLKFLADRITSKAIGESAFKLRRLDLNDNDIPERLRSVADGLDWLQHVSVEDTLTSSTNLLSLLDRTVDTGTGLIVIDYAQAFDAEGNEKSVERVIARLAWGLNQLAKKYNIAVVLFSQLKTEVKDRGNKWYENWRWKNQDKEVDSQSIEAVEGYRPRSNDLQWSSALAQRAKQIMYIFRPKSWLRKLGVSVADDEVQVMVEKGNYGPNCEILRFKWDGATCKISEWKDKKK